MHRTQVDYELHPLCRLLHTIDLKLVWSLFASSRVQDGRDSGMLGDRLRTQEPAGHVDVRDVAHEARQDADLLVHRSVVSQCVLRLHMSKNMEPRLIQQH